MPPLIAIEHNPTSRDLSIKYEESHQSYEVFLRPALLDKVVDDEGDDDSDYDSDSDDDRSNDSEDVDILQMGNDDDDNDEMLLTMVQKAFNIAKSQQWDELVNFLTTNDSNSSLLSSPSTSTSATTSSQIVTEFYEGNLLLHEVCQNEPPAYIVDMILKLHPKATAIRNTSGFLPIHLICFSSASTSIYGSNGCGVHHKVGQKLLKVHPSSIKSTCNYDNQLMLPLHIACKFGVSIDLLNVLLAYDPEAMNVCDGHGNLPLDYVTGEDGNNKRTNKKVHVTDIDEDTMTTPTTNTTTAHTPVWRLAAMECLSHGPMLRATSRAAIARMEEQDEERRQGVYEGYDVFISALQQKHKSEINSYRQQVIGYEYSTMRLKELLEDQSKHVQEIEEKYEMTIGEYEKEIFHIQEQGRVHEMKIKELYAEEVNNVTTKLEEMKHQVLLLNKEIDSKNDYIEELEQQRQQQQEQEPEGQEPQEQQSTTLIVQRGNDGNDNDVKNDSNISNSNNDTMMEENMMKQLRDKIVQLERSNAMKDRIIKCVSSMAYQERTKCNTQIIDLTIRSTEQRRQLNDLKQIIVSNDFVM